MKLSHSIINLLHIFIVFPAFVYVGMQRNNSAEWIYPVLFGIGLFMTLYHLYGAYIEKAPLWVHAIHFFYVGPLLMYIGYNAQKTGRKYYEILLVLAFAAGGYHALNYLRYN